MEINMKNKKIILIKIVAVALVVVACFLGYIVFTGSSNNKDENRIDEKTQEQIETKKKYISDQTDITKGKIVSEEDYQELNKKTNTWAKAFLFKNEEDYSEKVDREKNFPIYLQMAKKSQRQAFQLEKDDLFLGNEVKILGVETEIQNSNIFDYDGKKITRISFKATIKGNKNANLFEHQYEVTILAENGASFSVLEIPSISRV